MSPDEEQLSSVVQQDAPALEGRYLGEGSIGYMDRCEQIPRRVVDEVLPIPSKDVEPCHDVAYAVGSSML